MVKMNDFHFRGFSDLDNYGGADFLMHSMDVMYKINSVQSIKKIAIDSMNLNSGDKVLEIGCGHGQDAEAIAKIVGANGLVEAIDSSSRMISEAQKRSKHNNVHYSVMPAQEMNFNDNFFSACHVDRLLVSSKNYENIFNEILRVIMPAGRICITDVDALSILMYPFNDTTQKILNQIHKVFVNPFIGRMLPELFIKNNLKNIKILPELLVINDFDILSKIFNFSEVINILVDKNELTIDDGQNWIANMLNASKYGIFLYCVTFFTVVGQK